MVRSVLLVALLTLALPAIAQEDPGCTCTCQCAVNKPPPPPPPPPVVGLKFHPGHYMTLNPVRTSEAIRAQHMREIDAIANEPVIRGIKLWLPWGSVEKGEGDYSQGFAIIDQYLAKLAGTNRYLILSIQDRIFGGYSTTEEPELFPTYLKTKYGLAKGTNVTVLPVWNPAVMDRYIAMNRALAARYDNHPNFEMIQTEETSLSLPAGTLGYSFLAYGAQLKRLMTEGRDAWKRTQLRLSFNFYGNDAQALELMQFADLLDVAIGPPDVFPNQTQQANRLHLANFLGKMIWVSEVQDPELGGYKGTFTADQLYATGMQNKPSYFLWYRNMWAGGPPQKWDTGLLPFIKSINGRIETACPSNVVCAK